MVTKHFCINIEISHIISFKNVGATLPSLTYLNPIPKSCSVPKFKAPKIPPSTSPSLPGRIQNRHPDVVAYQCHRGTWLPLTVSASNDRGFRVIFRYSGWHSTSTWRSPVNPLRGLFFRANDRSCRSGPIGEYVRASSSDRCINFVPSRWPILADVRKTRTKQARVITIGPPLLSRDAFHYPRRQKLRRFAAEWLFG